MNLFATDIVYGSRVGYIRTDSINRSFLIDLQKKGNKYFRKEQDTKKGPFDVFYSAEAGLILPLYVKKNIEHLYHITDSYCYIETIENNIYWLIVDNEGKVINERLYELTNVSGEAQIIELTTKLSCLEFDRGFTIILANVNNDPERYYPTSVISESEVVINGTMFDLKEYGHDSWTYSFSDKSLFTTLINNSVSNQYLDAFCGGYSIQKKIKKIRAKKILGSLIFLVVIVCSISYLSFITKDKKEQEQALNEIKKIKIVDPYREYRKKLTDPNESLRVDSALIQIAYFLASMNKANFQKNKPLGWAIETIKANREVVLLTPKSTGGTRGDLTNYAKTRNIIIYADKAFQSLAAAFINSPLQKPTDVYYHDYLSGQVDYIADSLNWLFDDVTVTLANRAISGSGEGQYTTGLVNVDFKCWLPEDFIYASTQFAGRNYSFISLDGSTDINDNNQISTCGFSGNLKIEVLSKR